MKPAVEQAAFPLPVRPPEPQGSRRLHLPRTRLVLDANLLFGERAPRTPPRWRDY